MERIWQYAEEGGRVPVLPESDGVLLDRIYGEAGIARPVRVRAAEPERRRIEARLAAGPRKLLYVINHENAPVRLRLEAPEGWYREIRDLRARREAGEIVLPARQTGIYELW